MPPTRARASSRAAACPTATASRSGRCATSPTALPTCAADDSPEEARAKLAALIDDADVDRRGIASAIGPEHGAFADARDQLGGAQVPREARCRPAAGRPHRRHPLGRAGVPRSARPRAGLGRERADPAARDLAPGPAREASRVGRAAPRRCASSCKPAQRRCRGARRREPARRRASRRTSPHASSPPPKATRSTSSRSWRCSSTAKAIEQGRRRQLGARRAVRRASRSRRRSRRCSRRGSASSAATSAMPSSRRR